jgi:hypothetical protein
MKRILIIINKRFEADAVISAIGNADSSFLTTNLYSNNKYLIQDLRFPWNPDEQGIGKPRAIVNGIIYLFEIWCIQDFMSPPESGDTDVLYYSRSSQKAKDFSKLLEYSSDEVSLVIAFGTAGVPTEVTKNGGIVMGSNVYIYDAAASDYPEEKRYKRTEFQKLVTSDIGQLLFDKLNIELSTLKSKLYFEKTTLTPPINPAGQFQVAIDRSIVAISDVNISTYDQFKSADLAAINSYKDYLKINHTPVAYSVETTHGIIRLECGSTQFVFISAVTDRDAYFDNEVTPRSSGQNFSASFNGGLFLSFIIPIIDTLPTLS